MLYKQLIINGEVFQFAVNQTGRGVPNEKTVGAVGVLYMDTNTGDFYKCTSENNETYVWERFNENDYPQNDVCVKTVNGIAPDENGNVQIPVSGGNADQSGLTAEQISALDNMFKICAYTADATDAYKAFQTAFGIGGEVEPDEPDVPVVPDEPEKTLTSISAVYSGGSVTAGTAVSALTGIVVTAHYSDGTSATVTGYTLSGAIAEGSNTITVSYGGKTTTFTVTGIFNEVATEMSGYAMPAMPSQWSNDGDWIYPAAGTVLAEVSKGGFVYNKPFTGTIYVREFLSATDNHTRSSYMETIVIADNEEAINNPSHDTMRSLEGEHTCKFTLDGVENQQFLVDKDGTYRQVTSGYLSDSTYADWGNGFGIVSITRFDIPAGKVGYICTLGANRLYIDGWNAVFYEDVIQNPVATVAEVNE
jgi:hypothetical protein